MPTHEEILMRMSGLRKASIILLSLGKDIGAQVMALMDRGDIEDVTREIAEIEGIAPLEQDAVLDEFYNLALAHRYMDQGGLSYAQALLEKSLAPEDAADILRQVTQTIQQTPFQFLQKAESENVLTFIQDEHPQTIALILAHLQAQKSSEILMWAFPAETG